MATFNCLLGTISGKVGDVVFRNRGGKVIVAAAPRRRKLEFNPERQKRENKFAAAAKIGAAINASKYLKQVWKDDCKCYTKPIHNKILKMIYQQLQGDDFNSLISILPAEGFEVNGSVVCQKNGFRIKIIDYGADVEFDPGKEKFILAAGILLSSSPLDISCPPIQIINLTSNLQAIENKKESEFSINSCAIVLSQYNSYQNNIVHLHLLTLDKNDNVIHYSQRIHSVFVGEVS